MITIHQKLILSLGTVAALGCGTAWADPAATGCGSLTGVQRRIVEHADLGMEPLRAYVNMTAIVHGINMTDVVESLDAWRTTARCQEQVAAAKASTPAPIAQAEGEGVPRDAGH